MSVSRQRWLICGAIAAVMFVGLAVFVAAGATAGLDRAIHDRMYAVGAENPGWLAIMRVFTRLGDTVTVVTVDALLAAGCLITRRRRTAFFVIVTALLVWGIRLCVRDVIGRPRPSQAFWTADGSAFPSGHATNSAAMLALVLIVAWPRLNSRGARLGALAIAGACASAVGLSRIAGGVHWATDVLGGWLLAATLITAMVAVLRRGNDGVRVGSVGVRVWWRLGRQDVRDEVVDEGWRDGLVGDETPVEQRGGK
jgi:undecaprenyl-diphosphatase